MLLSKSASFRSSSWTFSANAISASNASCVVPWPRDPRWPGTCHSIGTCPLQAVALLLQGTCYYFSYGRPWLLGRPLDGPCLSPTARSVGKPFRHDAAGLSRPCLGIGLCLELCLHLSYLVCLSCAARAIWMGSLVAVGFWTSVGAHRPWQDQD